MATAEKKPRNLPNTSPDAAQEARTQADEYDAIFGDTELELDNGDVMMIPPHPQYGMLDDDRMDAWDELQYEVDTSYDREPDIHIPEQKLDNGLTLPSDTQRGALLLPYRITSTDDDGTTTTRLIKPSHSVRVVQVTLGDTEYKRLKEGGRNASDVWKIWGRQSIKVRERQQRDSKSASSPVAVAPVSEADS